MTVPEYLRRWTTRAEAHALERAALSGCSTDVSATERVPHLPPIIARSPICSPLLPSRVASAFQAAGLSTLHDIEGWTLESLLLDGVGEASATATIAALRRLAAVPVDRLESLCGAESELALLPRLPADVLVALCYATTVDEEIAALACDLPERNRALAHARWGYGADGPRTLEDIGQEFGITRERARQIVTSKEQQIAASGLRLPLASSLVEDLDEVGGALPDEDFYVLLRYGPVSVSQPALRLLPALHQLGCIPEIAFDDDVKLWLTRKGKAQLAATDASRGTAPDARRRALRYLRRIGAVPVNVLDTLSPYGRDHGLSLLSGEDCSFHFVGDHALRSPVRDSALLRQCRKTLVATGRLTTDDLFHGLRRSGFSITVALLGVILECSADFAIDDGQVMLAAPVSRDGILSAAEAAGFALLDTNGGAMSWWDFVEAMIEAGFSGPMAAVVLKKPAVRRLGPSTYGLRGRHYERSVLMRLSARRLKLSGPRVIRNTHVASDGDVLVTYVLNRFAMQGVLPAPVEVRSHSGHWTASFPNGRLARIRIAKGFVWPLQSFFAQNKLRPGDEVRGTFQPAAHRVLFEVASRADTTSQNKSISREQQILRALFGNDI